MVLYDVSLAITYAYDNAAEASRHIVRLLPADLPGEQRLIAGALTVKPEPDEWINRRDFFNNGFVELAFREAHKDVTFSMQSRVERSMLAPAPDSGARLAELGAEIVGARTLDPNSPHHFLGSSTRVSLNAATTAYARQAIGDGGSVTDAVVAIGQALHRDMSYDPEATEVDTPMLEAFAARHGVCQDFSHIMIACLRGIGIPAGYVSGFLRTLPPPGQARLEGADAMHAWVRAWCGAERGWIEYDPTNAMSVSDSHIVLARGRDYSDVAPIKGVLRTTGGHTSKQVVDVVPVV